MGYFSEEMGDRIWKMGRSVSQKMKVGLRLGERYGSERIGKIGPDLPSLIYYLPFSAGLDARRRVLAISPLIRRPTDSARSRSADVLVDDSV